jgi:hypothetical protein
VVSFTPLPLYTWDLAPGTLWLGDFLGPRSILDATDKR